MTRAFPAEPARVLPVWTAKQRALDALARLRRSGDLWYIGAAAVVNVANFAFFGLVGHLMAPRAYGAVAALLNVVSVASIPLNAVQAAVVQEVVRQSDDGQAPAVGRAGMAFMGIGTAATVVLAAASPWAASFFGLSTAVPIVVLALWLAPSVPSSLFDGVLIGTLRWRPIAASLIAGAAVRVAAAAIAGLVAPGTVGPLLATVLNAATTLGVVLWAFHHGRQAAPSLQPPRARLRLPVKAVSTTVLALTGYSALIAIDTVLARHVFPAQAGGYAAAVTIGRIALFLPMAITVIGFPRFVSNEGQGPRAQRLLLAGLASVLAAGLGAAGTLYVGRHIFVGVLFGQRYVGAQRLIGPLALEGAFLGAVGLLTYFHLACRSAMAAAPAITTVGVIATALYARPGPTALAQLMVAASLVLLVTMTVPALSAGRRWHVAGRS